MAAYYNEHDKFAAAWLRELIKARLIADGEVDERDIQDVRADDVRGFTQCHFFAGIGGWSYALRLAGWPDDRPLWTGSCPCQPFSSAGKGDGTADSRDLWPAWFQLIRECRPVVVFGEQVEAALGHGWFDRLCDDLEGENYAVGACGLPGPVCGAYDIRARLWFVAHAECGAAERYRQPMGDTARASENQAQQRERIWFDARNGCEFGALDNTKQQRAGRSAGSEGREEPASPRGRQDEGRRLVQNIDSGATVLMGNAGRTGPSNGQRAQLSGAQSEHEGRAVTQSGRAFWADADWLPCRDGKARPVEPGTFPLAHGVSARVGRLRGYGNAIKPPLAQAFIEAYMSVVESRSASA